MRNRVAWGLVVVLAAAVQALAASSVARGRDLAPFTVSVKAKQWVVTLTPSLQRTIAERFPGYALPRSEWFEHIFQPGVEKGVTGPPFACTGDFDRNGLTDAILILQKQRKQWLLVAFNQTTQGTFNPHVLLRFSGNELEKQDDRDGYPPGYGLHIDLCARREGKLVAGQAGDAIQFWLDSGDSAFYYYRRDGYHRLYYYGE